MKWYYLTIKYLTDSNDHLESIFASSEADALETAYKTWPEAFDIIPFEGTI